MTIELKLFGQQARLVGQQVLMVDVAQEPVTCSMLREAITAQAPALSDSLASSRFAVNHAYAREDQQVHPGDKVALIGMIGGG